MRPIRLLCCVLGAALLAPAFVAPATAAFPLSGSPADQLLVVNANVRERNRTDMADWDDMSVFVRRVVADVPYAPDAVLLQEVRKQSAQLIALMLSSATGHDYELALKRGNRYARKTEDGTIILNETAILMNTTTVAKVAVGGHETFAYTHEEAAPGTKIRWKRAAHAALGEVDGDFALALASVHLPKDATLASEEIAEQKKLAWTTQMNNVLATHYPGVSHRVIGGDFNQHRCDDGKPGCEVNPFWQYLTDSGYRDAVRTMVGSGNPIDFIFSTAPIVDATADFDYDPAAARDTAAFYSDHRFRWALLEETDTTAPVPPSDLRAVPRPNRIRVAWDAARDGGGPIDHYEVFRSGDGTSFNSLGTTNETHFVDFAVEDGERYWYYVVAYDGAGLTGTSETITALALSD